MGKIRVSTIGDESAEKKQKEEAKKRKTAKKTAEAKGEDFINPNPEAAAEEEKTAKKVKIKKAKARVRSKKYQTVLTLVEKKKIYPLSEALTLLPKLTVAKFDETVELHINTTETGINGSVILPHGNGKKTRVTIVNAAKDPAALDTLLKDIESGKIAFDILIATPDSMPKLAKVARYLGPKGLMPNPKNGTVSTKPEEVAKQYEGGQMNFKTEAKFPIMHLQIGKVSFGEKKLSENITAAMNAIKEERIKEVTLKSTMSPAIRIK